MGSPKFVASQPGKVAWGHPGLMTKVCGGGSLMGLSPFTCSVFTNSKQLMSDLN